MLSSAETKEGNCVHVRERACVCFTKLCNIILRTSDAGYFQNRVIFSGPAADGQIRGSLAQNVVFACLRVALQRSRRALTFYIPFISHVHLAELP